MKKTNSFEEREIMAINYAIAQANDFVKKAKDLRDLLKNETFTSTTKLRSSARRSSMDLSRALTEFRRS